MVAILFRVVDFCFGLLGRKKGAMMFSRNEDDRFEKHEEGAAAFEFGVGWVGLASAGAR